MGLKGYHKLRKADLIDLVSTPQRPVRPVTILPTPEAMDVFEKREMAKSRPLVKSKLSTWYDWLINAVPEPIKERVKDAYRGFKNKVMGLYKAGKKALTKPTLHD